MRLSIIFALASVFLQISTTSAIEIGFKFSGIVTNQFAPPYGNPISASTAVVGRFIYDTASSATHSLASCTVGTCTGYEQHIENGYIASFGNLNVRADDYIALISNDTPVDPIDISQGVHDVFTVEFLSNLTPALTDPLIVGGSSQPTGRFAISMSADSSSFADPSLPTTLDTGRFPPGGRVGILSHNVSGLPDVIFSINDFSEYRVVSGDYNFDEIVDQTDYNIWRQTFGFSDKLDADGNRNHIVDAADYVVWRHGVDVQQFFSIGQVVPEPSVMCFALCLTVVVASRRSSRRLFR